MANQYSNDSLKAVVEAKYNMPLDKVLRSFQRQGVSLREVAKELGFKEWTVRKHALQNGCRLTNSLNPRVDHYEQELNDFYTALRSDRLNRVNVLSRSWRHKGDVIR